MKKLLLLFLTMLSISASGQISVYYPFPTDTAQWSVLHSISPPYPGISMWTTMHQNLKGDTIINNKSYHKIYQSYKEDYFTTSQVIKCYIREDSSRQIHVKYPENSTDYSDTSEFVLYDFKLSVGDTFYAKTMDLDSHIKQIKFTLIRIDSINTNAGYRKIYILGNPYSGSNCFDTTFYWIEGIGCQLGPFYNEMFKDCGLEVAVNYKLICFQENFDYFIGGSDCHLASGIDDLEHMDFLVKVYPNPFTDNITIELPETISDINLSLYDVYSRLVSTTNSSNTNKITLQNNNLPNGIYFYRLTSKNSVINTGKVIKN